MIKLQRFAGRADKLNDRGLMYILIDILDYRMKSYGHTVKAARKAKGWTLDEVAKRTGTHKGYISGIENSQVRPPAPKLSDRLAKALGLDSKDLLRRAWAEKAPKAIRAEVMDLLFPTEKTDPT